MHEKISRTEHTKRQMEKKTCLPDLKDSVYPFNVNLVWYVSSTNKQLKKTSKPTKQ